MAYRSHEYYMARAFELAAKSYAEGGCPIGGVLVDNDSGEVLGEGHNTLAQEGNPIVHGEMAALRDAGRTGQQDFAVKLVRPRINEGAEDPIRTQYYGRRRHKPISW